jgi:hypothetical protein
VSEYQYYEFQAVDRPLTEVDQKALRRLSSRAQITATSFTNTYHWGDFGGDSRKLMQRWFDLHLHISNFGTRALMIRVPKRFIDPARIKQFVREVDEVELVVSGDSLIIDICFTAEEYYAEEQGAGWMGSLAALRDDLLGGDLRLFYLLWLTAVQSDFLREEEVEPLPGIGPLSAPLEACAKFFRIDPDLVQAAAEVPSGTVGAKLPADLPRKVIQAIPEGEKVELLLRAADRDPHLAADLQSKIRLAGEASKGRSKVKHRTVAELGKLAGTVRERRKAARAAKKEAERLRKAKEAERVRQVRLDSVRRRGARVWGEVEAEIENRNADSYDRAASLLGDLQTLAQETGSVDAFSMRVHSIRQRHERKFRFIERLDKLQIGTG